MQCLFINAAETFHITYNKTLLEQMEKALPNTDGDVDAYCEQMYDIEFTITSEDDVYLWENPMESVLNSAKKITHWDGLFNEIIETECNKGWLLFDVEKTTRIYNPVRLDTESEFQEE